MSPAAGARTWGGCRGAALLLLALIALVTVLVVRNIADDDDRGGLDVTNDNAAAVYLHDVAA